MNEFIDFSNAKLLGVDLETADPYLIEDGPGWARGVGHVLGVAISAGREATTYIEVGKDPSPQVLQYLKDTLETSTPKVGANLQYDYGWLSEIGVWPGGMQYDIQYAEALLDDVLIDIQGRKRSISLDALAQEYLGRTKEKTKIEAYVKEKWPWAKDFRSELWRCPPELVAEYAIPDAWIPIEIFKQQWNLLAQEDLIDVFKLECRLIPLLVRMRRRGVPVDLDRAYEVRDELLLAESIMKQQLSQLAGFKVNVNSALDLAAIFDKLNVPYERTAKGNPSFTSNWLSTCDAPIAAQILDLRKLIKTRSTFIEGAIIEKQVNGKVYPNFHPLRGDEFGTISGRFSCTNPNLQQQSKRDKKWAPIVRSLFIPEAGYPSWACMDFSQIEYRLFAEYSQDPILINAYQQADADFHTEVGKIVGESVPRIAAKTISFGILYGMGKAKLVQQLVKYFPEDRNPQKRAEQIYEQYITKFPQAHRMLKQYAGLVSVYPHFVRTILGRKARFALWESSQGFDGGPYPLHIAQKYWGGHIRIAKAYKALNRLLQGSAADIMKKAMVDAYEAGIFDQIGYPHITVHDELDISYHPDNHLGFMQMKEIAETCVPLSVPLKMGLELGPNWAELV